MKKFAILAGLMALALVIGVAGTTFRADKAEARPTDVISFNPDVCFMVVAGDLIDAGEDEADAINAAAICYYPGLVVPANLNALAEILAGADIADAFDGDLEGAVDDPDTYADLVDFSAAQLGADGLPLPGGQGMWVLTFVTNDDALHLDADEGIWAASGASQVDCNAGNPLDEDCDENGVKGDGVVPGFLFGNGDADLGSAIITATQAGIDVEMDYEVVGAPDDIELTALESTIQEDSGADCDLSAFTDEIALPDVAGLLAVVTDEDGTELTGINVGWDSSDEDVLGLASAQLVTISSGGAVASFNLGCGGEPGDATVTSTVLDWDADAFVETDIDAEVDITVVGAPASMTLAVNPPSITCNGTNTAQVSATLLDSEGNPVVAGNAVRFEVVALGTASPIIAETDANGVATSTITPLSGVTAGVTVLVSVVDDDTIEDNILVACQPAVPTVAPTVAPPPVIPPVTGDAGLLP